MIWQAKIPASTRQSSIQGFSLIELVMVLALLALLTWLAIPHYQSYQTESRRMAMQMELLGCVQSIHALGLTADQSMGHPWLSLADGNGDGLPDSNQGTLASGVCVIGSTTIGDYDIQVWGSGMGFRLQAIPLSPSIGRSLSIDHLGRQQWSGDVS